MEKPIKFNEKIKELKEACRFCKVGHSYKDCDGNCNRVHSVIKGLGADKDFCRKSLIADILSCICKLQKENTDLMMLVLGEISLPDSIKIAQQGTAKLILEKLSEPIDLSGLDESEYPEAVRRGVYSTLNEIQGRVNKIIEQLGIKPIGE